MARFVILEFDDNDAAESFVRHMEDNFNIASTSVALAHADVRWVLAKPTKFCECNPEPKRAKSSRYGWWVCTVCKKPGATWGTERGLRTILTQSKDLKDAIILSKDERPSADKQD